MRRTCLKGAMITVVIAAAAVLAHAQVAPAESLRDQIAALLKQVQELQQRLAQLQEESVTSQSLPSVVGVQASTEIFSRTLRKGTRGEEVELLQEKLREDSALYPEGLVTGYFGTLTEAAIRRFQRRFALSENGVVDEPTRAALNEIFAPLPALLPSADTTGVFFIFPARDTRVNMGTTFALRWKPPEGVQTLSFHLVRGGTVLGALTFLDEQGNDTLFIPNTGGAAWRVPLASATTFYDVEGGTGFSLLANTHTGQNFLSGFFTVLPFNPVVASAQRAPVLSAPEAPRSFLASSPTAPRFASVTYDWADPQGGFDHYELLAPAHGVERWINLGKTTRARIQTSAVEGEYKTAIRTCAERIVPCPETSASVSGVVSLRVTAPVPQNLFLSVSPEQFSQDDTATLSWGADEATSFELLYDWDPKDGSIDRTSALRAGLTSLTYGPIPAFWSVGAHRVRLRACNSRKACSLSEWTQFSVRSNPVPFAELPPSIAVSQAPERIVRGAPAVLTWSVQRATQVMYQRDWFRDESIEEVFALTPTTNGTWVFTDTADPARWPFGEHRFRIQSCGGSGCTVSRWYNYTVTE